MADDIICKMTVDEATALGGEREGHTFYVCSIGIGNALRRQSAKL